MPLVDAGTYADDRACAVSPTGSGEFIIHAIAGHEIATCVRMQRNSIACAADLVMAQVRVLGGSGGVIVAGPDGNVAARFPTAGKYRGFASVERRREVAIYGDESLGKR